MGEAKNKATTSQNVDEENLSNEEVEQNEEIEEVIDGEVTDNQSDESVQLQEQIKSLKEENENLSDRMLRLQAEFENFKRRTNKERIDERKYKSQDLATELLPVLDNFERALQVEVNDGNKSIIEGITMVYNQLLDAFKAEGIEVIETENKPFDPNLHHAVMQVEDEEFESNIIVEQLQKGFILNERVIRPAMVKVNK